MVAAGYRDHVLISQDAVICLLGRVGPEMEKLQPNWTITHIFERVLPKLREQGMSDEDIDKILIDNPRKLFANAATMHTVERMAVDDGRSEEHTSDLQSLMRISSAVFCLKKQTPPNEHPPN